MARITIGSREIGDGCPPFVIAEVGINHNGDINRAIQMVQVAKDCGADAVKFQTFHATELVGDSTLSFTYKSQGKSVTEPMLRMFKRYELPDDQWKILKQACDKAGILFLSTPQNSSDLKILLQVGVPAIKVGSDDLITYPMLEQFAATGLPMILSSGMANLEEISAALDAVGHPKGHPTILLVCVSQYPTPPKDVNLLRLRTLHAAFPNLVLGFSDHTQGPLAAVGAVVLGAAVFEKHFTLDHDLPGPDHWFSEDPKGLKQWVLSIRQGYTMLGNSIVQPTSEEEKMKGLARRSLTAVQAMKEGDLFTPENLGFRRPGHGLAPVMWRQVIGKHAKRSLSAGTTLTELDIQEGVDS